MENSTLSSHLFKKFKPLCVAVAQNVSLQSVGALRHELFSLNGGSLKEAALVTYIAFPLKLHVDRLQEKDNSLILLLLNTLALTYTKSIITDKDIFKDQVNNCCALISAKKIEKSGGSILAKSSEEKKEEVLNILESLLGNADAKTFSCLYSKDNLPMVGHLVSLLLGILDHESSKQLRKHSLQVLTLMLGAGSREHALPGDWDRNAASVFANFIPGMSISLQRAACEDPKAGHAVSSLALLTWSNLIGVVMSDSIHANYLQQDSSMINLMIKQNGSSQTQNILPKSETPGNASKLQVTRDSKWLSVTSSNISLLVQKAFGVVTCKSHYAVSTAGITFTTTILCRCAHTLKQTIPVALEFLASCIALSDNEIAPLAANSLDSVQEAFSLSGQDSISLVENNLDSLLLSLPRVLRFSNMNQREIQLCKLYGYIQILGGSLTTLLNAATFMDNIMMALAQVFDVDLDNVKIIEERDPNNIQPYISQLHALQASEQPVLTTTFKYLPGVLMRELMTKITVQLVLYSDNVTIINFLLDMFESDSSMRIQYGLLVKWLMHACYAVKLGGVNSTCQVATQSSCQRDFSNIVAQVMEQLLSKEWIDLPTSVARDEHQVHSNPHLELIEEQSVKRFSQGLTTRELNYNIHLTCTILECIGVCSDVLGSQFQPYLISSLYPLLEKLGSDNSHVRCYAADACQRISTNCGAASITQLITSNADYLLSEITLSFRHMTVSSSSPNVLSVVFDYVSDDGLLLLMDIMDELFDVLDRNQTDLAHSIMVVLKSMNRAIERCFGSTTCTNGDNSIDVACNKAQVYDPVYYTSFFVDYCQTRAVAAGESLDQDVNRKEDVTSEDMASDTEPEVTESREVIPRHFQMVIKALERCVSFVTHRSIGFLFLVLDVIQSGVVTLKNRENDLLPLIHKMWPALLQLTKDSRAVVAMKALTTIEEMIKHSGDFMRQRVVKELLPCCCALLKSSLNQSKESHSHYGTSKHSSSSKLLMKIFQFLSVSLPALEITSKELLKCLAAMEPYLTKACNQSVQQAALMCVERLQLHQPDEVWLLLASVNCKYLVLDCQPPLKPIHLKRRESTVRDAGYIGDELQQLLERAGISVSMQ